MGGTVIRDGSAVIANQEWLAHHETGHGQLKGTPILADHSLGLCQGFTAGRHPVISILWNTNSERNNLGEIQW
jgi:hypothetical protein